MILLSTKLTRVRHENVKPIYFNIEIKYLHAFQAEFKSNLFPLCRYLLMMNKKGCFNPS